MDKPVNNNERINQPKAVSELTSDKPEKTTNLPTELTSAVETTPISESEKDSSSKKFGKYILVTSAAVAVLGGIGASFILGRTAGASEGNPNEASDKDKQTTLESSASAEPTETTSASPESSTTLPVITGPEIDATASEETIARSVLQYTLIDWRNAGITDSLVADQQKSGLDPTTYATQLSNEAADAYENSLFVDNWQSFPDIATFAEQTKAQNMQNILLRIETANDQYPFEWSTQSENVTVESYGSQRMDMHVRFYDTNNGTLNTASQLDPTVVDTTLGQKRINAKMIREGDTMKISSISKFNLE